MLTKEELRTYEKIVGFNLWQVEKDYLQHLVLLFLYSRIKNELVFKEGTALQKVFGLNRFSIDLDFSSTKNNSEKVFEKVVEDITSFGFPSQISKIEKSKTAKAKTIILKIQGPLYERDERTITTLRVEISLRKDLILQPIAKEVVPPYADLRPYFINLMDPKEILAEKVRALMWRGKARDLYDLWFILRKNVVPDIDLINKKLEYYNLKFNKDEFLQKIEAIEKIWEKELKPLVSVLPSFKIVKKDTIEKFKII
jgi:predicted nucleotidyltransferase component of viral defense system